MSVFDELLKFWPEFQELISSIQEEQLIPLLQEKRVKHRARVRRQRRREEEEEEEKNKGRRRAQVRKWQRHNIKICEGKKKLNQKSNSLFRKTWRVKRPVLQKRMTKMMRRRGMMTMIETKQMNQKKEVRKGSRAHGAECCSHPHRRWGAAMCLSCG